LDLLLVEKGLADSRAKAQALIMAGRVLVDGRPAEKPAALVDPAAPLQVTASLPFVSRGGLKLAHALDQLHLPVEGLVALDVGASTGGFTDCLLQRGAVRVYALDVGYGQLDYRLRQDPRVVVMERVNAHYPFDLPETVGLCTLDVSFISLTKVIPNTLRWVKPGGHILALVKPQFEAQRGKAKRGVVKDPLIHAEILGGVILWAVNQGLRLRGLVPSPILGPAGNREFFVLLEKEG
jgi:23S rRNA (cytidine1920-2'-O)/16S rRNA (cytidine1409-2'-O)-methyltransferase